MIEDDKFRPALFDRLTAEDLRVDASAFAYEMQAFVKRIGILHWAMDRLAMSEFETSSSNEWMIEFSNVMFEAIYRDAQKAEALVTGRYIGLRKAASLDTLEAMKAIQRAELAKTGLKPAQIEERVRATTALVEAEMERWSAKHAAPSQEAA